MADQNDDTRSRREANRLKELRKELEEMRAQTEYCRRAAEESGKGRLRETEQLTKLC
jgi:hypothetical protein